MNKSKIKNCIVIIFLLPTTLFLSLCSSGSFSRDATAERGSGPEDTIVEGNNEIAVDSTDASSDTVDSDTIQPPEECKITPSTEPFADPVRNLHWGPDGDFPFPDYINVLHAPIVVDFIPEGPDEDMIPEIVFVSYKNLGDGLRGNGVLRVISGREPYNLIMTLAGRGAPDDPTDTPILHWDSHPAAGDIDDDGQIEVVVSINGPGLIAYNSDGSILWESDQPPYNEKSKNASIAIANIDGEGLPEIVIGRCALDADGNLLWCGAGDRGMNGQGPLSCVADLDGDGLMEIVAGASVYDYQGNLILTLQGEREGFCGIADLFTGTTAGKDSIPEIVRVRAGRVYINDSSTGEVLASFELLGGGKGGAPTIADFDGDGLSEVGVAGASKYVVFDIDTNSILWSQETEDDSSNVTASTVFDFNGDGTAEVVYNDEQRFMVFNGPDGTLLFEEWNPSRTRTEEPIVADVDNDGNAEIVFCANVEASFAGDHIPSDVRSEQRIPGIEIWGSGDDSWVSALPYWNQHTFHIDNINDDGTIPLHEEPSWISHNTYRLNSAGERMLSAPDLLGEPSDISCTGSTMTLCVRIKNEGEIRVGPGIEATFYQGEPGSGGTEICTASTSHSIEPGNWDVACCDWANAPSNEVEIYCVIDPSNSERECREGNNELYMGKQQCSPFG